MKRTREGHDPCIARLPGVRYACCGHGVHEGYIQFENGVVLRGYFTDIERDIETLPILADGKIDLSNLYIARTPIREFELPGESVIALPIRLAE
jgi:hypothetical protein